MSKFDNIEVAFHDKSNKDLKRAYYLFKTINNPIISNILIFILKIAIFFKLPINKIIKATIYKQFCGGTTIQNSESTINKLWNSKIGTILDFSAEGKKDQNDFNKAMYEIISSIKNAKEKNSIPFSVFKATAIARIEILEKISNNEQINEKEEIEKTNFLYRIEKICQHANKNQVALFIDAEESWIQKAIDDIAIKMMMKFNKKNTVIFNTIQMYRKDRMDYLKKIIKDAKKRNYFVGIKLVRGAYHQQEITRSKQKKYDNPVYTEKTSTDKNYNDALELCVKNINIISLCAGTHNEKSCILLTNLLKNNKIEKNDKRIYFSQLFGMSDHISYNAAKEGFNVAKYVPYGPVKEVIPYLIRRAEENTSIKGQISRELTNIIKEIKRRKKKKKLN